jgi:hypothetical protein
MAGRESSVRRGSGRCPHAQPPTSDVPSIDVHISARRRWRRRHLVLLHRPPGPDGPGRGPALPESGRLVCSSGTGRGPKLEGSGDPSARPGGHAWRGGARPPRFGGRIPRDYWWQWRRRRMRRQQQRGGGGGGGGGGEPSRRDGPEVVCLTPHGVRRRIGRRCLRPMRSPMSQEAWSGAPSRWRRRRRRSGRRQRIERQH